MTNKITALPGRTRFLHRMVAACKRDVITTARALVDARLEGDIDEAQCAFEALAESVRELDEQDELLREALGYL